MPPLHIEADRPLRQRLLEGRLTRRDLVRLGGLAGLLAVGGSPAALWAERAVGRGPRLAGYPFRLGVASGDPTPDGIVLWTRLAPEPLRGGGMPPVPVPVRWELADDEGFRRVVRRGEVTAHPEAAHSVHVELEGLAPGRGYWYRFLAGGEASPAGRTRTAPAAGAMPAQFRLAFASCQNFQGGYYAAHRHLAAEELDLVLHLGDYIYEGGVGNAAVRPHNSPEIRTLDAYRNRYALYKGDPDLQAAHAAAPWVVTWDDHEVDNNYAGDHEERGAPREAFLLRRAAAYQAYYEHMPLRRAAMPQGASLQLYRRLHAGALVALYVLDTRQHRTPQPCADGFVPRCEAAADPAGTILGAEQERWLLDGTARSAARWNVLANQVPFVPVTRRRGAQDWNGDGVPAYSMDKWDGYAAQRARVHAHLRDARVANPVILTGDVHVSWVADLPRDLADPASAPIGTEFVGTSISSGGDGEALSAMGQGLLADNPHARFFNGQRGYGLCRFTRDRCEVAYRVVSHVSRPDGTVSTAGRFVMEAGRGGVLPG